jgi:IS4 transposase
MNFPKSEIKYKIVIINNEKTILNPAGQPIVNTIDCIDFNEADFIINELSDEKGQELYIVRIETEVLEKRGKLYEHKSNSEHSTGKR